MTIQEAITHCEEVAERNSCTNGACANEHRQIAAWLRELVSLRRELCVLNNTLNSISAHCSALEDGTIQ